MMKKVDLDGVKVNTIKSFTAKGMDSASALRIEMQEMVQGNLNQFHLHPPQNLLGKWHCEKF